MNKHIPILDSCTLTDSNQNKILIDHFAAYLKKNSNMVFPHRHSFYHIVVFTQGSGYHTIDFEKFDVTPGQIYFMAPGQIHTWHFSDDVDGYVINFDKGYYESFLLLTDSIDNFSFYNGIAQDGVIQLHSELLQQVTTLSESLYQQVNHTQPVYWDLTKTILLHLLMLVEQSHSKTTTGELSSSYALIKKFQRLIETDFASSRLPSEYASQLNVTPNHLNIVCKEHLGHSAGEEIRNRIVLEAKRLLVVNTLSITEIAYSLAFNDNSYFSKFFKKHTGMTPEEFRKKRAW
ncbi:AraC family transcriptional regulator [Fulvivirga sediminis]|uniref:Helix-turn-helix domain-containing protein n=1 Tax=Fulvivirga sediminis TaxID=2803949 RepID=A0A937F6K8_9BACT|nr:helix-turn-helix domain-containing protein [Fulvivirga sediminis]MBL3655966.1 helix-turn-helix domain-containing protein [Fulvivirga sediminis]